MGSRKALLVVTLTVLLSLLAGGASGAATAPDTPASTRVIVVVRGDARAGVSHWMTARHARDVHPYSLIPAIAATVSLETLEDLKQDPDVVAVYPDHWVAPPQDPGTGTHVADWMPDHPLLPPAAEREESSAGKHVATAPLEPEALQLTGAGKAWAIKVDGKPVMGQGIRVGLTDTGTDPYHPGLRAAVERYRDFTGGGMQDWLGHGTATSGCIASRKTRVYNKETGTYMTYVGMAPRAKVLMAKVGDVIGGYDSQFIRGIEWLVDQKVDIISDSWIGPVMPSDGNDPVALAVKAAVASGITYCVGACNDGPGQGTVGSPSDVEQAVTVGASTGFRMYSQLGFLADPGHYRGDQVFCWSSRAPTAPGSFKPDIMSYGGYGWALDPVDGDVWGNEMIQEFGGTSMATPILAGDLALAQCAWKLAHPGVKLPAPAYWKKVLAGAATNLGYPAPDQSAGMVNAAAAVNQVLRRGKSMQVTVKADGRAPTSWSAKVIAGGTAASTLAIKNTGSVRETVRLAPLVFTPDEQRTITNDVTLQGSVQYRAYIPVTVPAGTEFVETRLTWSSGPGVSIASAVYDSADNLVSFGSTYGGYGHLSLNQISLTGPAAQRPALSPGDPWHVFIFPRPSQPPTAPTQLVHLRVTFFKRTPWSSMHVSPSSVTIAPGKTASVKATLAAPTQAGTSFGGIAVSNGSTTCTVPVSIRVPVALTDGEGTFAGTITGSTIEYYGGEVYFYDLQVPADTVSLAASLTWPHQGNLVNLYLVDPQGEVRDAKGGDLVSSPDYAQGLVPASAFLHTSEQVVWSRPEAGSWQLIVWAPGFSGDGFSEPFSGRVKLDGPLVTPAAWTASVARGTRASTSFTLSNPGPTSLDASVQSQATSNGAPLTETVKLAELQGSLYAQPDGYLSTHSILVPQGASRLACAVSWQASGPLIDLSLYDPTNTSKSVSLAAGPSPNVALVENPVAGSWTVGVGVDKKPGVTVPSLLTYGLRADVVMPQPLAGFGASVRDSAPLQVPAGNDGVIEASIDVPPDLTPGTVIHGTLTFYTVASGIEVVGGDRLAVVPVTLTVE